MVAVARSHAEFADGLRQRISGTGVTDPDLRSGAMDRAAGGSPIAEPYDALAQQIGEAAYRVTDAQVAAVREAAGTDKGAFEIVLSASIGAGLMRWDAAMRAIEEAADAAR
jgi:hypothetical protein